MRRLLVLVLFSALLSSAGCFHHRHFCRHHDGCCGPVCGPACGPCGCGP